MFRIIRMNDIVVPATYNKPKQRKIRERKKFYKTYKIYKVPIVVQKKKISFFKSYYVLADGYTSYLIAKWQNKKVVKAIVI